MIAVGNSPIVVSSASAASTTPEVATDGGRECNHLNEDDDCLICELQEKYEVGETITDNEGDKRPARSESPDMGGGPNSGVDKL